MANIFKAKTLVSRTGIFSHEVIAPNLVYNTGDQTISGIKTFATGVNINGHVGIGIDNNNFNLYVRKSKAGVTVNPDGDSIAVFEGSGNSHITVLASNAQTAGVVLGSPADSFGAYLTWNHDNNALKLATANPNGFIQLLTNNEAEAVRITSGANVGIGTTSPSEKLEVIGNILANNLVYNTGNQTISGIKTFAENAVFGDPSQGDFLVISGNTFTIYGSGNFTSGLFVNGNAVLTGVNLSSYATTANLALTGSTLDTKINNLSGVSVLTFGDQNISGNKNFLNNIGVSGTGVFSAIDLNNIDTLSLSGVDITITSGVVTLTNPVSAPNLVYNTGNQTISGVKTFIGNTNISGNLNVSENIFLSGNPVLTGSNHTHLWSQSIYDSQVGGSDAGFAGRSGGGNLVLHAGTQSTSVPSFYGWDGFQNTSFTAATARTNLGLTSTAIAVENTFVRTTGDQTISGVKTFIGNHIISGDTTITGHLSATSKSFLIDHPTQTNKKLQYGSLESPYHGIRLTDKNKISAEVVKVYLPEYISSLVNDEKVNIQLTNINHDKNLFIKEVNINENNFTVGMNRGWFDKNEYEFYWSFTAERKDIPKLTVEF